jgi:hypothetical protein
MVFVVIASVMERRKTISAEMMMMETAAVESWEVMHKLKQLVLLEQNGKRGLTHSVLEPS